ncbi:hypothetical protein GW17_00049573 [Ensete ventricosum]|uniref:Uncharacterized protein n=1 Tax=Ensete ventricosum TaxID=4639 RepID=A0A444CR83_ENSVE|nr:hypothetical protein B296_00052932 [Ensete ventricosum]RWV88348.1 hypothetical protein GW17_00049573 [Ensete ventricosum]
MHSLSLILHTLHLFFHGMVRRLLRAHFVVLWRLLSGRLHHLAVGVAASLVLPVDRVHHQLHRPQRAAAPIRVRRLNNSVNDMKEGGEEGRPTYHDGQGRGVHADGEEGSGDATEDLAVLATKGQQGDESDDDEDGKHQRKQPRHASPRLLGSKREEDDHVHRLNGCPGSVDRRHQDVVW